MRILVVVDMQNDFIDGPLGTFEAQDIVNKIYCYIVSNKKRYDWIFFTKDTHFGNYYYKTPEGQASIPAHCIQNTEGAEIVAPLKDIKKGLKASSISKTHFGYSEWNDDITSFLSLFESDDDVTTDDLDEIEIDICGVCTDICVITNAILLQNLMLRPKVRVLKDLCAGSTPEAHEAALNIMRGCLIEVVDSKEINR